MGSGGKIEFNKYLEKLKLIEEKPDYIKKMEREIAIKKAHKNANRIIEMDKKKGD